MSNLDLAAIRARCEQNAKRVRDDIKIRAYNAKIENHTEKMLREQKGMRG